MQRTMNWAIYGLASCIALGSILMTATGWW